MTAQLSEATAEPTTEALHLRRLIEQQPACLLRVGIDGLLLAVNEAALSLLGGESLTQVLGSKLTKLIIPRQHEEWEEFAARIRDGASGSIECDLADLSGMRRTILLQGIPLLDHVDGIPSMMLTARDISAPRRLEAALREREISRELDDLQKQLQRGFSEPRGETVFEDREVDLRPLIAEEAAEGLLRQTLAEEHQAALLLKEQEAEHRLDSLRTELEQAVAEQQRLTTLLDDREIGHQRVVAALGAERAQLEQTLAEGQRAALLLQAQQAQQRLDHARTELEQVVAEQQRLTTLLEDREAGHRRAVAALAAERAQLQQTLAEEHQLALLLKEREGRQQLDSVRIELDRALADRQRFAKMLDEHDFSHQRTAAEQVATRAEAERALAAAVLKQTELEKALADQRVELQAVAENARNLEWLAAAGRVAMAVGRELQTIVEAVDVRTQHLLVESALDADKRHVIEALRGDAIEAASLTRQIVHGNAETPSGEAGRQQ